MTEMVEQKRGISKGCLIALVIIAAIIVLIIAMSIICYVKRDSMLQWGVIKMTETIKREALVNLPDSLTESDIDSAATDFIQALKNKSVDQKQMRQIILVYQDLMKDGKIDKDECKRYIEELRRATHTDAVAPK
ncbi:MAG: hypothetical protein NTV06_03570 [candidate division Zixibacteria bacterium]|nr:hypothetical protein [candidate division Zixibacteria bacterium]